MSNAEKILAISLDIKNLEDALEELKKDLQSESDDWGDAFKTYSYAYEELLANARMQMEELLLNYNYSVDFWITLEGAKIAHGTGSAEHITSFLSQFRVTSKHAASVYLKQRNDLQSKGGRFKKHIENASDFKIAATASGSFKIGLQLPDVQPLDKSIMLGGEIVQENVELMQLELLDESRHNGIGALKVMSAIANCPYDDHAKIYVTENFSPEDISFMAFQMGKVFVTGIERVAISSTSNIESSISFDIKKSFKKDIDSFLEEYSGKQIPFFSHCIVLAIDGERELVVKGKICLLVKKELSEVSPVEQLSLFSLDDKVSDFSDEIMPFDFKFEKVIRVEFSGEIDEDFILTRYKRISYVEGVYVYDKNAALKRIVIKLIEPVSLSSGSSLDA